MRFLILLLLIVSCTQNSHKNPEDNTSSSPGYSLYSNDDSARLATLLEHIPLLKQLFQDYAKKHNIPGLSFAVVVGDSMLTTGSFGYANISTQQPVTDSTQFRIASMSKSFTAMAVLKLRDEGKLQLDDPVEQYIPLMRDQVYPTTDAPLITVRHLLTHGAGFPEDNPWGDRQLADTDAEFMAFLKEGISFSNPPGVQYEYSNLGFALLGKLITEVSGKPYQQYIREEILQPLSMNSTTWEYGDVAADKLAHGYRWINEDWEEQALLHDAPDGSWGAMGSMISSVEEFSRYISFHLSAWPPSSLAEKGPVRRSSVREMQHPWRFNGLNPNYRYPSGRVCAVSSAYGYGLRWLYDCEDRVMVSHSGGLPGFGSHWMILPDYGIGIVALANRTYAPMSSINMQAIDTLIRLASLKPKAIPISAILKQRQEQLLRLLPEWNGAESSDLFAENFFDDYKIDSLRKQTKELYEKAGTIKRVNEIIALNNLRGHFTIEGENASLQIFFTLSPEKEPLIQAFDIWEKREE